MDSLPDELLLIILEYITELDDCASCSLVSKKWLGIVSKRIQLKITNANFKSICQKPLMRLYKSISLKNIQLESRLKRFHNLLENSEVVVFRECTFGSVAALKSCLMLCKNMKILCINKCKFKPGIIEALLNDQNIEKFENANVGHLKFTFENNLCDWQFIKTFATLGIGIDKINLKSFSYGIDLIKLLEYVKITYGSKLKELCLETLPDDDKFYRCLMDWTDLQLESFACESKMEMLESFVEHQVSLKELRCEEINVDKCPIGLEDLDIAPHDIRTTLAEKLPRLNNLRKLNCFFVRYHQQLAFFDISFITQMAHLEEFSLSQESHRYQTKFNLQLDVTVPLVTMRRLSLSDVTLSDDFVRDIIKFMPNLINLNLRKVDEVTAEAFSTGEGLGNLKRLRYLALPAIVVNDAVIAKMKLPFLRNLVFYKQKDLEASNPAIFTTLAENCPWVKCIKGSTHATRLIRDPTSNKFQRVSNDDNLSDTTDDSNDDYELDLDLDEYDQQNADYDYNDFDDFDDYDYLDYDEAEQYRGKGDDVNYYRLG